ncbi:MAG: RHS domain-containing protein [Acidobacteria bacterium]|nr:RHS domain-containing protein [Acidobacteriota bacterium]
MQTGSDVRYFIADHLGSTNALTDSSGNVTSSASYDSFGNASGNLATRYKFTGREYDDFTGLHYYRARWYDSSLGRFISEDPIAFAGGDVNLYGYVRNKPVSYSDPFGLDEYAMMERFANQEPQNRTTDEILDDLQLRLAVAGSTPIVGEPFDAVDRVISLLRGDYYGASMSLPAMLPFVGAGAGIVKICNRTNKIWNANPKKGLDSVGNAFEHWKKHKDNLPEYQNSLEYVGGARNFFDSPPPTTLSKVRPNGDRVLFDPTSDLFGVERNGIPSTFFRPDPAVHGRKTNLEYFYDQ